MLKTIAGLAITGDVTRHARSVLAAAFERPERQSHHKQYVPAEKHLYHPVDTGAPRGSSRSMYPALLRNESVLDCYEPQQPTRGADAGPLVAVRSGDAEIDAVILRPNDVAFRVRTRTDSTIQLNQNFVNGWRFSDAAIEVTDEQHRPTVRLPAGYSGEVFFYYLPASVLLGAGLVAVGVILALLPFVLRRRVFLRARSDAAG